MNEYTLFLFGALLGMSIGTSAVIFIHFRIIKPVFKLCENALVLLKQQEQELEAL